MTHASRRLAPILVVAAVLLSACVQWRPVPVPSPGTRPPGEEYLVWSRRQVRRYTQVSVAGDSLRGTRRETGLHEALALADIDSLKVASVERTTPIVLGLLTAAVIGALIYASAIGQGLGGS